jgi:hypothetical protein
LDALGFHLTGYAPTAVELSGSTNIYHSNVNNSYYLVPAGTSSGAQPQLRYAGAGVTTGQFGPLSPIGAERNSSGGYSVVWKMSGADQYTVWTTDGAGNYASQTPMVTSASWYVQSLEQSFAQDLNGDGRIGPVTTNVEAAASTTLAQVADSYFLYAAGTSSGPQAALRRRVRGGRSVRPVDADRRGAQLERWLLGRLEDGRQSVHGVEHRQQR